MMREGEYRLWKGEVFEVLDAETIKFIESGVTVRNHTAWEYWMQSSAASRHDIVRACKLTKTKTWIG